MTIRRGGNPRDDNGSATERPSMAHRPGEAVQDAGTQPPARRSARRSGTVSSSELARRRGGGAGGGLAQGEVMLRDEEQTGTHRHEGGGQEPGGFATTLHAYLLN